MSKEERCEIALSSDGKKCVESCEKGEFLDTDSKRCSVNCQKFSYKFNYQKFCAKQCPTDTVEDIENQ